jgi:hypothetical protein
LKVLGNQYPARLQAAPNAGEADHYARRHGYFVSSYLLPSDDTLLELDAQNFARLRVAQTVVALERYRLKNERQLPLKLSELFPRFLHFAPLDPFDGYPLRYTNLPEGYIVYSIGKDLKDNGGTPWKYGQASTSPYDIVVRVDRVESAAKK